MNRNSFKNRSHTEQSHRLHRRAFTLIEVLLSMVILAGIMLIVTQVIGSAQRSWKAASSRVSQFREARTAFDAVSRGLRQAALPTYRDWDYTGSGQSYPNALTDVPLYIRSYADFGFVAGKAADILQGASSDKFPGHAVAFIAPLGKTNQDIFQKLPSLPNVRGFFVKFGSDTDYLPRALSGRLQPKSRYRLYEYRPPAEKPSDQGQASDSLATDFWTTIKPNGDDLVPIAENIVTLVFGLSFAADKTMTETPDLASPATSSSSKLPFVAEYNSFKAAQALGTVPQLPHSIEIIMIALDEESATKLAQLNGSSPPPVLSRGGSSFKDPANYDRDVRKMTEAMREQHLNYRVFSSIINIPGSKT
jgi:uncharacterized protein (TIGR02599 family)